MTENYLPRRDPIVLAIAALALIAIAAGPGAGVLLMARLIPQSTGDVLSPVIFSAIALGPMLLIVLYATIRHRSAQHAERMQNEMD